MDWLDLLAVQSTLKSLLQHRSAGALGSMEGVGGDLRVEGMLGPEEEGVPQKVRQGKEGMELDWS